MGEFITGTALALDDITGFWAACYGLGLAVGLFAGLLRYVFTGLASIVKP